MTYTELSHAGSITLYLAIFISVALQCSGIPVPAAAVMSAIAIYAGLSQQLSLLFIVLIASVGSMLGSIVGYYFGKRGGYRIVHHYGRILHIDEQKLKLCFYLFREYGALIIIFGRFISPLRTFAAFLAGLNYMRKRSFLLCSMLGSLLWSVVLCTGNYYLGNAWHHIFGILGPNVIIMLVLLALAYIIFLIHSIGSLQSEAEAAYPGPLAQYLTDK